jgi:AdoMet-dependent heme synthase
MQPMHNIPARGGLNFDETPFLAIWEVTQSCDLACKHCRAAAQPIAHPDQLTNAEGKALIDQIAEMGMPIFVFAGGDPLKRRDVFEPIQYAAGKVVKVALTPSAAPLLTREAIFKLKEAGLVRPRLTPPQTPAWRSVSTRRNSPPDATRSELEAVPPQPRCSPALRLS